MTTQILVGDVRAVLPTLEPKSVHTIVTSPPYWNLRSYLPAGHPNKHLEIGSEPTVHAWVATLVHVMSLAREVLRDDGTLWLNLGDSYAGSRSGPEGEHSTLEGSRENQEQSRIAKVASRRRDKHEIPRSDLRTPGFKAKDLIGQPWRLAFALQADGWWLRQEIIWAKSNPMPESTRDRCTKAHEHVFLLSKSERYYYNFDAVQEPVTGGAHARGPGNRRHVKHSASLEADRDGEHRTKGGPIAYAERKRAETAPKVPGGWDQGEGHHGASHRLFEGQGDRPSGWAHGPDRAHDERAGRYPQNNGVGFGHGADRSERMGRGPGWRSKAEIGADIGEAEGKALRMAAVGVGEHTVDTRNPRSVWTIPTHPFKGAHFATFPPELARRCLVAGCPPGGTALDLFGGSGTVGLVADQLQMNAILIDLDERNLPMARDRIMQDGALFAEVAA